MCMSVRIRSTFWYIVFPVSHGFQNEWRKCETECVYLCGQAIILWFPRELWVKINDLNDGNLNENSAFLPLSSTGKSSPFIHPNQSIISHSKFASFHRFMVANSRTHIFCGWYWRCYIVFKGSIIQGQLECWWNICTKADSNIFHHFSSHLFHTLDDISNTVGC